MLGSEGEKRPKLPQEYTHFYKPSYESYVPGSSDCRMTRIPDITFLTYNTFFFFFTFAPINNVSYDGFSGNKALCKRNPGTSQEETDLSDTG